ncbi:hypothetical protein Asfd1_152 [Aeromonas phage Asfd_1]|nr:hypothetical protein Asfd1_152 [Aeromonas phage Asfd_1]
MMPVKGPITEQKFGANLLEYGITFYIQQEGSLSFCLC